MPNDTFDAVIDGSLQQLDEAESLLRVLRRAGVFGQDRDFTPYIDVDGYPLHSGNPNGLWFLVENKRRISENGGGACLSR
jgi:hypothetical protein